MIAAAPIAREEYAERIGRVRERMDGLRLETLVCYGAHVDYAPGDLRDLTDWFCIEEEQAILVVPADGPVTLLTDSSADLDRARERAVCDRVELASDLGATSRAAPRWHRGPDGPAGASGARHGVAPGGGAGQSDASALTTELRIVKSPAEVELLTEAARARISGWAPGSPRSLTARARSRWRRRPSTRSEPPGPS